MEDVKISPLQLFTLMSAFIFGDSVIVSPAINVGQDAWIAFSIGWLGGFLLVGMYVYISILNPNLTLIEILRSHFGNVLGSVISIFYIWYFAHLASLIFRSFSEYMVVVNYTTTPMIVITIILMIVTAYGLKLGLEVVARASTLMFPMVPLTIFLLSVLLINYVDFNNLLPILKADTVDILKAGLGILTFPFGEVVVFLMIYPSLNQKEKLIKTTFISTAFAGISLLIIIVRNISIVGPEILATTVFSSHTIVTLIRGAVLEPFLSVSLLILGSIQLSMCTYATVLGVTQSLRLEDYKPLVLPILIIIVSLSQWIYENLPQVFQTASEIYPFYAIPFQIIIPGLLLVISIIKRKRVQQDD